jgi:hypothetical protein
MTCLKCSSEIGESAKFCRYCGATAPTPAEATMILPRHATQAESSPTVTFPPPASQTVVMHRPTVAPPPQFLAPPPSPPPAMAMPAAPQWTPAPAARPTSPAQFKLAGWTLMVVGILSLCLGAAVAQGVWEAKAGQGSPLGILAAYQHPIAIYLLPAGYLLSALLMVMGAFHLLRTRRYELALVGAAGGLLGPAMFCYTAWGSDSATIVPILWSLPAVWSLVLLLKPGAKMQFGGR